MNLHDNAAADRALPTTFFATGVCAAIGLLACTLAQAQGGARGSYIGVSQGFTHESNLFRAPSGQPEISDTYSSTGVVAGTDLALGRQRLYADANVRNNRFNDQSQLDNVSYGLTTGLDWQTLNRISGRLAFAANRNLASYAADTDTPRLTRQNIESTRQFDAVARIGVTTPLSFEAAIQLRERDFSAPEYASRELQQESAKISASYRSSPALSVGVGLRFTDGEFPLYRRAADGTHVSDKFERRDIDLNATWTPSGRSSLAARLSLGRQTHTDARQNDFSGLTGALAWTYQATGKVQVVTTLSRDTGTENAFLDLGSGASMQTGTSKVATAVQVAARYNASAKTQFNAAVTYTDRSLSESLSTTIPGVSAARSGSDRTTMASVGARYQPTRNVSLACNLSTQSRNASTTLSYDYSAVSANCAVQVQLDWR